MSNSWFGMAPRPSTPSSAPTINRSFSNGSVPNSPVRLPRIERVPSLDAIERSNHNDSAHGKSTIQIIKELKASNAKLSAKTAEMEADFMNKVNKMTTQFDNKENALQAFLTTKEQQLKTLESRTQSAENRIRERDVQLSKLKEETTFQRHTISDLKNQLYQLQHEIEDAEYDKRDGVDRWLIEKKNMEREMHQLREQLSSAGIVTEKGDVRQNWKQLAETMEELDETKKRLYETQSTLANLEHEAKRLRKENETKEDTVMNMTSSNEGGKSAIEDLKKQLVDRDEMINALRDEVITYSTQVAELKVELAEVKADSHSQNQYRQEEAEDLRVLNNSYREEMDRLKLEIEEMGHELDEKDEIVLQKTDELRDLHKEFLIVSKEVEESNKKIPSKDDSSSKKLSEAMELLGSENDQLQTQLKLQGAENLRKEIQILSSEKERLSRQLEDAEDTLKKIEKEFDNKQKQDDARHEKRLRDIVSNAATERAELESEFEARLTNVEQGYEKKILLLTSKAKDAKDEQGVHNELKEKNYQIQALREEVEVFVNEQDVSSTELQNLREKLRVFESKKVGSERAKKQLREAQIALVALDDEKTLSDKQHKEAIASVEKKIQQMEADYKAKLEEKDAQLREQSSNTDISDYVAEIERLKAVQKDKENIDTSRSGLNLEHGPQDEGVAEELGTANAMKQELQNSLSTLQMEKLDLQKKLKEKLEDRDTTISALVKASVSQEHKVAEMNAEIENLKSQLEQSVPSAKLETIQKARNADYIEEIEDLKSDLQNRKEVETGLLEKISSLDKKLAELKKENASLKFETNTGSDLVVQDHQEKMQERDSAIANLVKQSMNLEEHVTELKLQNSSLRAENDALTTGMKKQTGPSWTEVRRLQKESEIFAGQIIEQDEEMEVLRTSLDERDERILMLEKDLANIKRKAASHNRDSGRFEDLQAELDEMQEANDTHRVEIRELRKQLRDAKAQANEVLDLRAELEQAEFAMEETKKKYVLSTQEDLNLRHQLDAAQADRKDIESKLNQQIESIHMKMNSEISQLEEKLKEKEQVIDDLRADEKSLELETEIKQLSRKLFEKSERLEEVKVLNEELRLRLNDRKEEEKRREREEDNLFSEAEDLRTQLLSLESDRANINAIKEQLKSANEDKEMTESRVVETYERKLSLLNLEKDTTIDRLRKELVEAKTENSESNDCLHKELVVLEQENNDVRQELEAKLHLKNTKIHALEQTLEAQEQLVDNMRSEMDQLQSTMERTSLSRRAEIEEMQQEMIDTSSRAQKQEREITSLKMALEECRLEHQSEVMKLKEEMESIARPIHMPESKTPSNSRLNDVKERLENLKWRNTSLQEENLKLRNRLERVEQECETARVQNDSASENNAEVIQLRKRVHELEENNNNAKTTIESMTSRQNKPPQAEINGSRWNNRMSPPSRQPAGKTQSTPTRKSQNGALRFLKRRTNTKEMSNGNLKKSTTDDSSSASKNTF